MKLVIFGLTVSSSWGNGHATLWRGLCRSLARRGHEVVFFERDVPYYAAHRDLRDPDFMDLILYTDWNDIRERAGRELAEADAGIVTSYCPDALVAADLVLSSKAARKVFYDLDTSVTLQRMEAGESVEYVGPRGYRDFDLVLSFTGGRSLSGLKKRLGAKKAVPLYGSVDPESHRPGRQVDRFRSDLSYLGTYAVDRQAALDALFIQPALKMPERKFLIGGSMYPQDFPWQPNIHFIQHVAPDDHPDFFASSRLTLNITRRAMARLGWCPSGRLFEAAACGTPILSDEWDGIEDFFEPDEEILIARSTEDTLRAMTLSDRELGMIASAARDRVLESHTADHRAAELERFLEADAEREKRSPGLRRVPEIRPERRTEPRIEPRTSNVARGSRPGNTWGVIPAAGAGTRIQPLAFSKELLPVGSRFDGETERPRAASEYLVERMVRGGADRICFVISAGKTDIMSYFGGEYDSADIAYVVQPRPEGLCDAIFRAGPLVRDEDRVLVGLPDSIWFPEDGFVKLPDDTLSFLLFPVDLPQLFDAVVTDEDGRVHEIQVKQPTPKSNWIWGAFKMPGRVFHELHRLWEARNRKDEYFGTLVNAYLARGGEAIAVAAGTSYVDVGTIHGYREAVHSLSGPRSRTRRQAAQKSA